MRKEKNKDKIKLRGIVRHVYKLAGKAINDYSMIEDGDKVLVCISGGKDSWSAYRVLRMRQRHLPIKFEIIPFMVDCGLSEADVKMMHDYFKNEGLDLVMPKLGLEETPENCFVCSWHKRTLYFKTAQKLGCKKIVTGHHLDDIVETILMNMLMHGKMGSMCPSIKLFNGELEIIRPFSYVKEEMIREFFQQFEFPMPTYDCIHNGKTKRAHTKDLVGQLQEIFPNSDIRKNIFNALKSENIKKEYLHDVDKPIDYRK